MRKPFKPLLLLPLLLVAIAASGCSMFSHKPATVQPAAPSYDLVAAIRAAGADDNSIIDVQPLRDPGVTALIDAAHQDEQAGHYAAAAGKLDQALKISPDAPDLLQDRAEMAVRLKDFAGAERLAHQSWSVGPKLGPLCARNWQTIVEMRLQAHDKVGADTARRQVQQCRKAGIHRY